MSGLAELLAECDAHGIRLVPAGDGGLTVDAPAGCLTPDLVERLRAHKAELLAALAARHADQPTTAAGAAVRADESADAEPFGPDGWPADSIDPAAVPPCSKCGTLEAWQDLLGDWHCTRCRPPITALRLAEHAAANRRRLGLPQPPFALQLQAELKNRFARIAPDERRRAGTTQNTCPAAMR